MKSVTLKLDEATLDRVRHIAVDEHVSMSAWVQNIINRELDVMDRYEQDRKGALMVLREGLHLGGTPLKRDEVHERGRWNISFWDSLIIAAARRARVSTVWSEDLNAGQDYEGVQIANPLV